MKKCFSRLGRFLTKAFTPPTINGYIIVSNYCDPYFSYPIILKVDTAPKCQTRKSPVVFLSNVRTVRRKIQMRR